MHELQDIEVEQEGIHDSHRLHLMRAVIPIERKPVQWAHSTVSGPHLNRIGVCRGGSSSFLWKSPSALFLRAPEACTLGEGPLVSAV